MRPRLALILCALLLAALLPTTAQADARDATSSPFRGLLRGAGLETMVFGVPVSSNGLAEGDSATDEDDEAEDASDPTPPSQSNGYGGTDAGNEAGFDASVSSEAINRTLIEIIIGIIFGQDRPWESKKRG